MLRKRARDKAFFLNCLDAVMSTYVKGEPNKLMRFYLACLVYPKDVKKQTNFELLKPPGMSQEFPNVIIEKIHGILYCYSHEKMREFTRIPELATLFLIFESSDAANEFREDSQVEDSLNEIKTLCEQL